MEIAKIHNEDVIIFLKGFLKKDKKEQFNEIGDVMNNLFEISSFILEFNQLFYIFDFFNTVESVFGSTDDDFIQGELSRIRIFLRNLFYYYVRDLKTYEKTITDSQKLKLIKLYAIYLGNSDDTYKFILQII